MYACSSAWDLAHPTRTCPGTRLNLSSTFCGVSARTVISNIHAPRLTYHKLSNVSAQCVYYIKVNSWVLLGIICTPCIGRTTRTPVPLFPAAVNLT